MTGTESRSLLIKEFLLDSSLEWGYVVRVVTIMLKNTQDVQVLCHHVLLADRGGGLAGELGLVLGQGGGVQAGSPVNTYNLEIRYRNRNQTLTLAIT